MTVDLFTLLPAVYRTRDIELARSQALLTPAEKTELDALIAAGPPFSIDQQIRFDELSAKAIRGPLHSLLLLIQEQLAVFGEDLDRLYDDQFIETCAPWVIPYIGDLSATSRSRASRRRSTTVDPTWRRRSRCGAARAPSW